MAIDVECPKCSHSWSVPTAKAGRSIYCPECVGDVVVPRPVLEIPESEKKARVRPGHRPKTDHRSKDRTILIGAIVLLIGVIGVAALRIKSVMSDPNLEFDASPVTDLTGRASAKGADDNGTDNVNSEQVVSETDAANISESETLGDASAPATKSDATDAATVAVPSEQTSGDQARRRELAKITDIAVEMRNFPADVRGVVSNAVATAVEGAMERCRLTNDDRAKQTMLIRLEVKTNGAEDELWMSAQLTADGQPNSMWVHSASLGPISDQAFRSGILPPGLERDVKSFFTDLQMELDSARREFNL